MTSVSDMVSGAVLVMGCVPTRRDPGHAGYAEILTECGGFAESAQRLDREASGRAGGQVARRRLA
ncbi:hypothetical protein GCM10023334_079220 [Nonomuraea thailandensis]